MFVPVYLGRRIQRFHRLLKAAKPGWVDFAPRGRSERDAYAIAARNEGQFSKAFVEATRAFLDPKTEKAFLESYRPGANPEDVLKVFPFINEGEARALLLEQFIDRLQAAYLKTVSEAGQEALDLVNESFGSALVFQVQDQGKVVKAKAKPKVPVVPVNPYSIKWIRERALDLVTQGVTDQQLKVIRNIIRRGFEKGIRAEEVYQQIKRNIGLTEREYQAVENRRALHESAELPASKVDALTEKYENELLKKRAERIARTETIAAQAAGRNQAWQVAADSGALPENVERVWRAAPESDNPNAPCEICLDLDNQPTGLGEPYQSKYLGSVDMPPAHPQCRCTEILRKSRE